ncbi:hypothetical protein GCM10020358_62110 [Amorphoplanes nipponensis]|uniref:Tight adherence protein B n=1 Tax=Actinoplanes nipponensis TaxID=135950 RepID=A0A919JML6_9ACTN|nr:hypothetical protein [Actinoplanes nipponensis]GIE51946.1 hypothetical protein Ani05nite_54800 [Actinoplanes nipponensis]
MSGLAWALAATLLAGAAIAAAWPARAALRRLHGRRRPLRAVATTDVRRWWTRAREWAEGSPRRGVGAAALLGAAGGLLVAGPIAGLTCAVYSALGAAAALKRAALRRAAAARSRSLDDLNTLAADLRAGLAISATAPGPGGPRLRESPAPRLSDLTAAVWRLAEQTGAPAADLVERIEADARAGDRARATAAAQAAGAQATALLLAGLPIGGIALGYGIGVDPLRVLLHTPLGGACAVGAVLLQCGGLVWADRLANGPAR